VILKLLSYNIRFGGQRREKQIAEVVRAVSPDIVVFQEASDPGIIEFVADATQMPFRAARAAHSIGFVSRVPIEQYQWHYPPSSTHSYLEIQLAGSEARIFGLHLKARFSKWSERRRVKEITALLKGIERHQHGFHVIVGDFNTLAPGEKFNLHMMPAWIRALIWLSGNDIKRETIQIMLDAGYVDCYRSLFPQEKGYTFPVWRPHVRLDYFFLPAQFAQRLKTVEIIKQPAIVTSASDHFPLLSLIEFE
jgi:exodeoxyribonuclease-3